MLIGISLVVTGLLIIGFSLFGLSNNPLSLGVGFQTFTSTIILFGIGFLIIGIRMLRKKKD